MVTLAEEPEAPDTTQEKAEGIVREVVAGNRNGAIRRIILWTVLFVSIAAGLPWLAIGAGALLAMTDDLA